jgi:uncharacterized membrane protein
MVTLVVGILFIIIGLAVWISFISIAHAIAIAFVLAGILLAFYYAGERYYGRRTIR